MSPFSIYLHIPFCRHRCGYCDFNTYAGLESLVSGYVQALCREITFGGASLDHKQPVHTIYFGGGTPSLLPPGDIERLLSAIRDSFSLSSDAEISLEANPGTLAPEYLKDLHSLGVNRLSLGVQSADPGELRFLEREHDFPDVIQSVLWARKAGFDNLSLDLIFGLPYQLLERWQRTLSLALGLDPEHLSLYALTLEHGTPLGYWARRGLISVPDPDLAAEMYELAMADLSAAGYRQYEISNWARIGPGGAALACRHNLQYWRNLPYLGYGAGAHGYAAGIRTANVLAPAAYIQRLNGSPAEVQTSSLEFPRTLATQTAIQVGWEDEIGETMMMGLRLVAEGISLQGFQERFGVPLVDRFGEQLERLLKLGLLERIGQEGNTLRLTTKGYLLGNQVFLEFL